MNNSSPNAFNPADISLIVFDFDGTLAELTIDFSAMRDDVSGAADQAGLDWSQTEGLLVLEGIELLAGSNGPSGQSFARRALQLIEDRELAAARQGRLFEGTRATLQALTGQGLAVAIITRNCRAAVELVFPDILDYCSLFIPRDDAPKPKPDPAHMKAVFQALDIPAEKSLMVGDHPIDIATARQAGAWACGVTTGRIDALGMAEADLVLDSINRLPWILGGGAA